MALMARLKATAQTERTMEAASARVPSEAPPASTSLELFLYLFLFLFLWLFLLFLLFFFLSS